MWRIMQNDEGDFHLVSRTDALLVGTLGKYFIAQKW